MKKLLSKVMIDWSTPLTILFVVAALLGAYLCKDIELKLSLTDLLPQDHPSVQKFFKLTDVVGGVGYIEAVLHSEDKQSHLKVAPTIVEELKKNPLVRSAFYHREQHFFLTRSLYYADMAQLKNLESSVEKGIRKAKRQMFDIGLWDDDTAEEKPATIDPELKSFAEKAAGVSPYLVSKDGKDLLVMVKPNFDSMDMTKSKQIVKTVDETVRKLVGPGVSFRLSGRYVSKVVDAEMIEKDIFILGLLANLTQILFLLWYFRSVRAVISIYIPVILGLGMAALFTRVFIGHINIITGFLVGIISGVGTDYGIHMLWRLRLEMREPSSAHPDPLWRTLITSGWANFVTIISTGLCFFMMCGSSFRVFSEFGFICGVGLTSILFAKLLSFYCTSKLLRLEKLVTAPTRYPFSNWILPVMASQRILLVALMISLVLAVNSLRVGFEYDFDKMMQHTQELLETEKLADAIYDRLTTPSAFATSSREEALAVENLLKKQYMPHTIESVVSGASIIPGEQLEKEAILNRINGLIRPIRDKHLTEAMNVPAESIRTWVNAKPFAYDDLPIHIQEALRGTQHASYLLYVYPAEHLNNAQSVGKFASMIKDVEKQFPNLVSGSDVGIFSDILSLIERDGIILFSLIILFVGVFIYANLRSLRETLLCYIPFLAALPMSIGVMALFGVKFNIFNTALLPVFIGVGVEIPIQLMQRAREIRSGFKAVRDIAVSLQLALVTTVLGFGILVFPRAGVLKSLGWISMIALGVIWIVGIFIQPAILEWFYRRSKAYSVSALNDYEVAK
ncbi:MAG: MMPL family transporter [Deltaproteobacteria bacterium]|nr:MMPL family transporter [Deltaproteobacteria bacterium]